MIKVVTENDVGSGLEIDSGLGKLKVKVDGTTVTLTSEGELKAIFPTEIHLDNVEMEGTKLKQTLNDGTVKEVDLADLVKISAAEGNLIEKGEDGFLVSKAKVIEAIKGEEVQSLSGTTLGYLITA